MSKNPKTRKCKTLFALLGGDPNEAAPANLKEAMDMQGDERPERPIPVLCPSTGKHSFTSQGIAKQAGNSRLRKGSNTGKFRSYQCPECSMWHLTSS